MSALDRAVLLTCAAAMAVGIAWQPIVDGLDRAHDVIAGGPAEPDDGAGPAVPRPAAEDVASLDDDATEDLLGLCLELPDGADPDLHPVTDEVAVAATSRSVGAGMVVWTGPVPAVGDVLGACVGMERAGEWRLANRSHREDPGPGAAQVTWGQFASRHGSAAGLVGRVPDDVVEVFVTLDDGRVLRQETDGVVAVVWSPVVAPVRVVTVDRDGEVTFDGPVTDYG